MSLFFKYILISSVSLSICYWVYAWFLERKAPPGHLRFYLLISIVLSLLLPFSGFQLNVPWPEREPAVVAEAPSIENTIIETQKITVSEEAVENEQKPWDWKYAGYIYGFGTAVLLLQLLFQLLHIGILVKTALKSTLDGQVVFFSKKIKTPFSFFAWILIPEEKMPDETLNHILKHEKVHASQYHSIDRIAIEMISAFMWFNPFVWMMRKSVQLVHEYLADEGALSTGIDRFRYQALIVNQIAEDRLISLSSSFNQSQIKKRMIMMTQRNFNQRSKLSLLALLPLSAVLFIGVACVNGQKKAPVVAAIAPVKMNVLYIGIDNPMRIAVSGYDASDLTVTVENGSISGENGEYVIHPRRPGKSLVTISCDGKEIQKTEFRVKRVPDPTALAGGKRGGDIDSQELVKMDRIYVTLENFDFDLSFEVVGFKMVTMQNGKLTETVSSSSLITDEQKRILSKCQKGDKLYFQDIKAKGPDGSIRRMQAIAFNVQ